jgi:hypothetical protein
VITRLSDGRALVKGQLVGMDDLEGTVMVTEEMLAKIATKPRITAIAIEEMVWSSTVWYKRVPETTVTLCALTLPNGFTVIGKSACVNAENFDEEIGKRLALDNAKNQLWELEGYRMCCEKQGV